jgi:hypothetical protein
MTFTTYGEFRTALSQELDIEDETFVQPTELVRYFNKAIQKAESLIFTLHQDYFLTFDYLPLTAGQAIYDLPADIYAIKVRGIIYNNGSKRYALQRVREKDKFERLEYIEAYQTEDFYKYIIFSPSLKRLTVTHDNAAPSVLTLSGHGLYENERIQVEAVTGGTLPVAVTTSTDYYAVQVTSSTFQIAASRGGSGIQLATGSSLVVTNDGPKIRLSPQSVETSSTNVKVWYIRSCKRVNPSDSVEDRDTTTIDIPEFSNYILSYVKAKVLNKEGSAMLPEALQELADNEQIMVDTLQQMVPDNDDVIEGDFSSYEEMS